MVRRSLYSPPDPFSVSPLVTLLPVKGKIAKLDALTSSLYARYEKVKLLQQDAPVSGQGGQKRYVAEASMLKQVLDWLSHQPESTLSQMAGQSVSSTDEE